MTLYCPNCNHEFAPDDRHCGYCGMERPAAIQKVPTMILSQNLPTKSEPSIPTPSPVPAIETGSVSLPPIPSFASLSIPEPKMEFNNEEEAPKLGELEDEITDPSIPSFWQCAQCTFLNPTTVEYCENCGATGPLTDPVKLGHDVPTLPAIEARPIPQDNRADVSTVKVSTTAVREMLAETARFRLVSSNATHEGLTRKGSTNEDSQFSLELNRFFESRRENFGFYVVADGMGGQAAGEVASRMAIEHVSSIVLSQLAGPWTGGAAIKRDQVEKVLREAVLLAHTKLREYNQRESRDAGTTLTACCVVENWAVFANVGDSRTYLFRLTLDAKSDMFMSKKNGADASLAIERLTNEDRVTDNLNDPDRVTDPIIPAATINQVRTNMQVNAPRLITERVTRDQSLVQNLVDHGELTNDEVYTDPRRNVILYALGAPDEQLPVDLYYRDLEMGDTILLCSDGLWEMVRDKEIAEKVETAPSLWDCSEDLIALANQNGGADNISVIVVRLERD